MKKLYYLLFLLPLAFLASCSDDDDLAQVDLTVTLSNVTEYNNEIYAVAGEPVSVDGVAVESQTDKSATIANVFFYYNGVPIFGTIEDPFPITFSPINAGTGALNMTATILQVDKSINQAALSIPIKVVADQSSLPAEAPALGTFSYTFRTASK